MFKNDSFTEDQCTSRGFNIRGGPKFFTEIRSSRNQYDRLDNEVKPSTPYLPRTHYSLHSKNDLKISACNHFEDLNEKFHELECKMFEVEKCFKEANNREMDDVQRLMGNNDNRSQTESGPNAPRSRIFEIAESRKETSDGIKQWLGNQHSNVPGKNLFKNKIVGDGSGDTPQLPNEAPSQDSCKTMIKSSDKLPAYLLNRQGTKGLFTMKQFDNNQQHESTDVDFLEKSKKLILTLIDNELKKIETKPNQFLHSNVNQTTKKLDNARDDNRNLKIDCINNIERELKTLRKLELLEE